MLASTGVIGEVLEVAKIVRSMPDMAARMAENGWEAAARAIMTTDTYAKGASAEAKIGNVSVRINGTPLPWIATHRHQIWCFWQPAARQIIRLFPIHMIRRLAISKTPF